MGYYLLCQTKRARLSEESEAVEVGWGELSLQEIYVYTTKSVVSQLLPLWSLPSYIALPKCGARDSHCGVCVIATEAAYASHPSRFTPIKKKWRAFYERAFKGLA